MMKLTKEYLKPVWKQVQVFTKIWWGVKNVTWHPVWEQVYEQVYEPTNYQIYEQVYDEITQKIFISSQKSS